MNIIEWFEQSSMKIKLLIIYSLSLLSHPIIMFILFNISIETKRPLKLILILLLIGLILIAIFAAIYYFIFLRRLALLLDDNTEEEDDEEIEDEEIIEVDEESIDLVNKLPIIGSVMIFIVALMASFIYPILYYNFNIIFTGVQLVFFTIIGLFTAFIVALFHNERIKLIMYPLTEITGFRPLSISEKLLTPIITFMTIILLVLQAGIYRINVKNATDRYDEITSNELRVTKDNFDTTFYSVITELTSYLNLLSPNRMTAQEALNTIRTIFDQRVNKNAEMLFFINRDRMGFTSSSRDVIDISGRKYVHDMFNTNSVAWSDFIINKVTGRNGFVCAVPNLVNGIADSGIGAHIDIGAMTDLIDTKNTNDQTKSYALISTNGQVLYHKDASIIGKFVGKDIVDEDGKNLTDYILSNSEEFHQFKINGENLLVKQITLKSTGHKILQLNKIEILISTINTTIRNILIALVIAITVVSVTVYKIGMAFSTPINQAIGTFEKLTDGYITEQEFDEEMYDEFGTMIRNMNLFQNKLKEVIDAAMTSSNNLAVSAEQMAATSSSLADSAQSQAAAVEEATASLEEMSAANEAIADNSKTQSEHSKNTYNSMQDLGK
ncbi:MAG: methyl-accepting chemotaxis protein, partial [Leptospirales bacterium]|nr:methyl-accepting chemotaxis protein [Leptospirales bacterium]